MRLLLTASVMIWLSAAVSASAASPCEALTENRLTYEQAKAAFGIPLSDTLSSAGRTVVFGPYEDTDGGRVETLTVMFDLQGSPKSWSMTDWRRDAAPTETILPLNCP